MDMMGLTVNGVPKIKDFIVHDPDTLVFAAVVILMLLLVTGQYLPFSFFFLGLVTIIFY